MKMLSTSECLATIIEAALVELYCWSRLAAFVGKRSGEMPTPNVMVKCLLEEVRRKMIFISTNKDEAVLYYDGASCSRWQGNTESLVV